MSLGPVTPTQVGISFTFKPLIQTAPISTDEQIAESVFSRILETYKSMDGEMMGKIYNGRLEQLLALERVIKQLCVIVDNEMNRNPKSGGILTTRAIEIHVRSNTIGLPCLENRDLSYLMNRKQNIGREILLVSQVAVEAINRLIDRSFQFGLGIRSTTEIPSTIQSHHSPDHHHHENLNHHDQQHVEEIPIATKIRNEYKSLVPWIIGFTLGVLCFPLIIVFAPWILIFIILKKY